MRELKFRAWNKETKKIIYFEGIFNKRPYTETSAFSQYESCPKYHELELMQYTGLKDKNGNEIYEGDILKGEYTNFDIDINGIKNYRKLQVTKAVVRYERGIYLASCYESINIEGEGEAYIYEIPLTSIVKLEIIGNIHQNTELLETK